MNAKALAFRRINLYNLTMSRSANLMRLQNIDSQIQKILNRIKILDEEISDNSELMKSEKLVAEATLRLGNSQKKLKQAESLVEDLQLKIGQTDSALYGGKIRNPKELQDLQNEADALRRYLSVLEDRQLEAMISYEDSFTKHQQVMKNDDEIKSIHQQKQDIMSSELSSLSYDLNRLNVEREVVTQTIDKIDLAAYEKLRDDRRGIAITTIIDHTCGACGTTLTPATIQSAQSPTQIVQCPSCRRILYSG